MLQRSVAVHALLVLVAESMKDLYYIQNWYDKEPGKGFSKMAEVVVVFRVLRALVLAVVARISEVQQRQTLMGILQPLQAQVCNLENLYQSAYVHKEDVVVNSPDMQQDDSNVARNVRRSRRRLELLSRLAKEIVDELLTLLRNDAGLDHFREINVMSLLQVRDDAEPVEVEALSPPLDTPGRIPPSEDKILTYAQHVLEHQVEPPDDGIDGPGVSVQRTCVMSTPCIFEPMQAGASVTNVPQTAGPDAHADKCNAPRDAPVIKDNDAPVTTVEETNDESALLTNDGGSSRLMIIVCAFSVLAPMTLLASRALISALDTSLWTLVLLVTGMMAFFTLVQSFRPP